MKNRLKYIDIAKGLLIIFLIIFHFSWALNRNDLSFCMNNFHIWHFHILISCFFMPAFFIISGFCSNFDKDFNIFFKNNTKSLIVPLIAFSVICIIIGKIAYGNNFNYEKNTYGQYISFWFLSCLYLSKLLIWFMNKLKINIYYIQVISILIMIIGTYIYHYNTGINLFAINLFPIALPFVSFGFLLHNNKHFFDKSISIAPFIFVITFIIYRIIFGGIDIFVNGSVPNTKAILPYFILASSGSLSLLNLTRRIKQSKVIEYFGKNTLLFYCLNITTFPYIVGFIFKNFYINNYTSTILCCIYSFIIQIIIWYLFEMIIKYRPFKWLLGNF